jgi:hypothetical protein
MSYPQYTQHPQSLPDEQPTSGDQSVTERAAEAAEQGKQAAGDVAQTAADRAGDVKDEALRQTRDLLGEARSQVTQQAGQQHQALVTNLRNLGDELNRMRQNGGESGIATELAGQAQQRVSSLADWLAEREPNQLLDEARAFARRRPGTFLAGALVAGVVAGRLARGAVDAHTGDGQSASSGNGGGGSAAQPDAVEEQSGYSTPSYSAPSSSASTQQYGGPPTNPVPQGYSTQPASGYSTPPAEPTQAYPQSESWR